MNNAVSKALILTGTMLIVCAGLLRADELSGDKAVDAGREALRGSASYPWYDAQQDELRDLHAKTKRSDDTDTRKTGWEAELPKWKTSTTPRAGVTFPTLASIIQYTALIIFVGLVGVLAYYLVRYFLKEDEGSAAGRSAEIAFDERASDVDRVEQLPFQVRRPDADLLSEARRLYEQQRYDEAIVYLFSYQLVELDRHQHIHLSKGKTNRQYLRELRGESTLRGILHRTMIAFEDVFFGHHSLDRARFEDSWRQLDAFQQALEQGVAA